MKKLLLLLNLVLGYSTLVYGMDDDGVYRKFTENLAAKAWPLVIMNLIDAKKEQLPRFILCLRDCAVDLNTAPSIVEGKEIHFLPELLGWYVSPLCDHMSRKNLREVLKELIKHNKLDSDLKGREISPIPVRRDVGLEMLKKVRDEIEQERIEEARVAAEREAATEQQAVKLAAKIFKKRCMVAGVVGACIMAVYAVYRWCTKKVDKDTQQDDDNQHDEHHAIDVHN